MFKAIFDEIKKVCRQLLKPISSLAKINNEIITEFLRTIGVLLPFSSLSEISKMLEKDRSDLDAKIKVAHNSLEETSNVLKELEDALLQNTKSLERIKIEYERLSKLTQIEEEDAKVLLNEVTATVEKGKAKERWFSVFISLATGLIIFVLGIWLGPIITDWLKITGE